MIRFACPRCRSEFDVPDDKAGMKTHCPRCQQRLQVPLLPPNRTVMAPLVSHQPTPAAPQAHIPVAQVAAVNPPPAHPTVLPSPEGAGPDPTNVGRPRGLFWTAVIGGGVVLVVLLGLGLRLILTGGHLRSAGAVAENRSHTRLSEEELVKRFILNNAEGKVAVTFLTWGPHMMPDEVARLLDEAGPGAKGIFQQALREEGLDGLPAIIRVRFKCSELDPEGGRVGRRPRSSARKPADPVWATHLQDEPWLGGGLIARPGTHDMLFLVANKMVLPFGEGLGGDDWKTKIRKELSKSFPGVER